MTPRRDTTTGSKGPFQRFRKDEDGGMIIFSLFLFVLILWFGGMAVDLMRFETVRTKLQGTLDRATLASADLDQLAPPEEVCLDYFEKAGMASYLESCEAETGVNYRSVTAEASAEMPLFFYDLPRVFATPFNAQLSSLTVSGSSTAKESVTDVEVSLVLDVSTSMNSNNRITLLRPAARDFVSTVLANNTNAPHGLITISMIPYSAVVNPGPEIVSATNQTYFTNVNRSHGYSTCLQFDENDLVDGTRLFETTQLPLDMAYEHVAHFDPEWYGQSYTAAPIQNPWCSVDEQNSIVVATTNEGALHTAINDLVPYGNTAIDMGMKWGVGLLDPSTNALISGLANDPSNPVPLIAQDRPMAYNTSDSLKVVVLMTDGQNTQQYDLWPALKFGESDVWFDLDDPNQALENVARNRVSVQIRGRSTPLNYDDDWFYWNYYPSSLRIQRYPNGYSSHSEYKAARIAGEGQILAPGIGATYTNDVRHASWQELYAIHTYGRVNNSLLSRAYNHGYIYWDFYDPDIPNYMHPDNGVNFMSVNYLQANQRLSDICRAARDQGIVIYTIAFEAPTAGENALRDCASPGKNFDVSGTDISTAFAAIASDIRNLKLTQ